MADSGDFNAVLYCPRCAEGLGEVFNAAKEPFRYDCMACNVTWKISGNQAYVVTDAHPQEEVQEGHEAKSRAKKRKGKQEHEHDQADVGQEG